MTGDTILYFIYANGDPVGMEIRGTASYDGQYYYLRNGQGDITYLVDVDGNVVATYEYDEWCKPISTPPEAGTPGALNPLRYRGYYYDSETGLYYLNSRYYNLEMGRFISPDAILGGVGELLGHILYTYCANNAVNSVDSSGFRPVYNEDGGQETAEEVALSTSYMQNNGYADEAVERYVKVTKAAPSPSVGANVAQAVSFAGGAALMAHSSLFQGAGIAAGVFGSSIPAAAARFTSWAPVATTALGVASVWLDPDMSTENKLKGTAIHVGFGIQSFVAMAGATAILGAIGIAGAAIALPVAVVIGVG